MIKKEFYHIQVTAKATFIESESDQFLKRYIFAYTINIENTGEIPAKLLSRHWIITDANSVIQEVRGQGVIGQQPYLKPGENFQYTSGTMIETPVGTMQGSFQMIADDNNTFDAIIEPFTLAIPKALN